MIATALALVGLIPLFGLAIDASYLYVVRAKMAAAADASALAGARNAGSPSAAAERTAAYFRANFPEGFMNTSRSDVAVSVGDGRKISVTAEAAAPLLFLRAIGFEETILRVRAEAVLADAVPRLTL